MILCAISNKEEKELDRAHYSRDEFVDIFDSRKYGGWIRNREAGQEWA